MADRHCVRTARAWLLTAAGDCGRQSRRAMGGMCPPTRAARRAQHPAGHLEAGWASRQPLNGLSSQLTLARFRQDLSHQRCVQEGTGRLQVSRRRCKSAPLARQKQQPCITVRLQACGRLEMPSGSLWPRFLLGLLLQRLPSPPATAACS